MGRVAYIFLGIFLLGLALVAPAVGSNPCWPDDHPCTNLMTLTNSLRTSTGLSALTCDTRLRDAAQEHSDDMAQNNFFSHQGSDGSTFYDRIKKHGYPYKLATEVIAAGSANPVNAINSWRNTPGFLKISDPGYTQFGCGFSAGGRFGFSWSALLTSPGWSAYYLTEDATYQYAIVTYDLERVYHVYNASQFGRCIRTQFIHDPQDSASNAGSVVFMGKQINLHLNQIFCGPTSNTGLWEGAGPYCPGAPENVSLPIDINFTGTGNGTRDLVSNVFVNWRNRDLNEWGFRLAQCDMTMYSAYLLLHGEGLQHAVLRPGTGATVDNLLDFLRNGKRCLVQSVNDIDNPDLPGLTNIFFFSLYECPGDTYEEKLSHPNFPYAISTVVEVVTMSNMPKREEFAALMREEYGIDIDARSQQSENLLASSETIETPDVAPTAA